MEDVADSLFSWLFDDDDDSNMSGLVEDILEWLDTNAMLNDEGQKLRGLFWKKYVRVAS